MRKHSVVALIGLLAAGAAVCADPLWAPKAKPARYTPPHKPHTKLADLKARHKGENSWRELIVDDRHLRSEYISAAPGYKHPKALHPDTREWWVVMEGEVRFEIESAQPFVARKGSMVQAPMQTFFSWEVVGNQPALIFDTNIAGARTLYTEQKDTPKTPGVAWLPMSFNNRAVGQWLHNNKPHVTFEELATRLDSGQLRGTVRVVEDDRGAANFIYGYNKKLPPLDPKARGHYHPEGAEYWLIMAGQIRYPIEDVGVVIADVGDVVYVPEHTFHFPRWWGDGASCRLAMNGFPNIAHLFEAH
ncbi:MAG: cupin domain-containing protein [Acidobacteria bacterium]|nr:cupin domain-containing protein [Acidobacteriota bacterium]